MCACTPFLSSTLDLKAGLAQNEAWIVLKYTDLSVNLTNEILKMRKILDNSVNTLYTELIVDTEIMHKLLKNGVCYTEFQAARLKTMSLHTCIHDLNIPFYMMNRTCDFETLFISTHLNTKSKGLFNVRDLHTLVSCFWNSATLNEH